MTGGAGESTARQLPSSISVLQPSTDRSIGALWRRWRSGQGAHERIVARALQAGPRQLCRRLDLVGWHHLQAAESIGRGVVVVAGPFGLWPLAIAAIGWYQGRILVDSALAGWWSAAVDTMPGFGVHEAAEARDLASMVENGGRVAVDLAAAGSSAGQGISVPFNGFDLGVSARPAQIAVQAGAPLLIVLATQTGDRLRVEALPVVDVPATDDHRGDGTAVRAVTGRLVDGLALALAERPEMRLWR